MAKYFNIINQYKGCLYQYSMRTRFYIAKDISAGEVMKKSIGRFRPVFLKDDSYESKILQYKKMLKKIRLDLTLKNGFIYFIDQSVVPYNAYKTIDNMPMDYDLVVNHSLGEMIRYNERINNTVSKSNIMMLEVIKEFIERIVKCSDNENKEQVLWIHNMMEYPAKTIDEALQRILFWNQLFWQTDHLLNGLGRLDRVLSRFQDDKGSKEAIKRFIQTLHLYYEYKSNAVIGDTGQIIILGGIEPNGEYFCNSITYSFISSIKELNIPDPKLLLRSSSKMPEDLLKLAVECIAIGCGSPLLSNDDVVIKALESFGYEHEDACSYGVSACWEPLIIGNSLEQNNLFDIEFGKIFSDTYHDLHFIDCQDDSQVMDLYLKHLTVHLSDLCKRLSNVKFEKEPLGTFFNKYAAIRNMDMSEGGSKYNNYGLLSVGLSSVVDSLINIKRFVFTERLISLKELVKCLECNYEGYEEIKRLLSKKQDGFGSDSDIAVHYTNQIMNAVSKYLENYRNRYGGKVKFGLSSPSYVNSGKNVPATADGRISGTPFPTHISREVDNSILNVINFSSALDYSGNKSNGNVVDLIIQSSIVNSNFEKFIRFIKACISAGIFQMQLNILSYSQLLDAKMHPETYPDLIVRVWGFSAYFKDIPDEYQNALIERARISESVG